MMKRNTMMMRNKLEMKKILMTSDRIDFCEVSSEYTNDYLLMMNDSSVNQFLSVNPKVYTYEKEEEWIRKQLENKALIFTMLEKQTNSFIGNIELMDCDYEQKVAELGISITPKMQNKHYGTEGIRKIVEYGFNDLKLETIFLNVFSNNPRAINCYKRCGFTEFGEKNVITSNNGTIFEQIRMKIVKKTFI